MAVSESLSEILTPINVKMSRAELLPGLWRFMEGPHDALAVPKELQS
jgi:hypothetical protein